MIGQTAVDRRMQIAFLSTREAKPSYRFRVERLLPYFKARGHACETYFLPAALWRRLSIYGRLSQFDVVFLQKRLLSRLELMALRRQSRRLIYDIDDAVMFDSAGGDDRRRQQRFAAVARSADLVVCGNQFLADEAARHTKRVVIVPTCIDTDAFRPDLKKTSHSDGLAVGWTGSRSTNRYLNDLFPVLSQFHGAIQVKIISDTVADFDFARLGGVRAHFVPWSPAVEISEAATFDIGVMPIPDNRWTQGKCGFKLLQYMSLGIPAVCSPVGANREIVHDGIDGLHADNPNAWFQAISRLVHNPRLRETIGHAGRRRVEEAYALSVHGPRLVQAVEGVTLPLRKSA